MPTGSYDVKKTCDISVVACTSQMPLTPNYWWPFDQSMFQNWTPS